MRVILLPPDKTARQLGIPIKEADLHTGVATLGAELLPDLPNGADLVIAQELSLAYGRPDIVAAAVDVAEWRRRRTLRIEPCTAPLPLATAVALDRLGGHADLEDLLIPASGPSARSRVRRSLTTLIQLGWVRRRRESFVLRLIPGRGLGGIGGVEAKLNNWRRAVRQVQGWEGYVDGVWLAFPAAYLRHVPRTSALRRFGLIAVQDGEAEVVRRPRGPQPSVLRRLLMEEYMYARWATISERAHRERARVRGGATARGRAVRRVT